MSFLRASRSAVLLRPSHTTLLLRPTITTAPVFLSSYSSRYSYSSSSSQAATTAADNDSVNAMTPAEASIASTLSSHESLRPVSSILVRDVSGGCGSMYAIDVASPSFRGKNLLAQQRLVNRALGDQVKEWHGVQIRTSVPSDE